MIIIFKKEEKKDLGNYREITLPNSILKIFMKIWENNKQIQYIKRKTRLPTQSVDYECYIYLRQLIEKVIEFNKSMFLCFVDLKQAFNRVYPANVFRSIQEYNI